MRVYVQRHVCTGCLSDKFWVSRGPVGVPSAPRHEGARSILVYVGSEISLHQWPDDFGPFSRDSSCKWTQEGTAIACRLHRASVSRPGCKRQPGDPRQRRCPTPLISPVSHCLDPRQSPRKIISICRYPLFSHCSFFFFF